MITKVKLSVGEASHEFKMTIIIYIFKKVFFNKP